MTSSDLKTLNATFETSPAEQILRWAVDTYPRAALTSSFGTQSAVLLHMATRIKPDLPVLFLDTGFLFKETHRYADELTALLGLNVRTFRPTDAELADARERLKTDRFACCDRTKVPLMERALQGVDCWIAGLRRDQASTRKDVKIVEHHRGGLVKVHPIARWSAKDVYDYMVRHKLPSHPLWDRGYTSVGCESCTIKPTEAGDERSGRWAGSDKTECGIHTFLAEKDKSK